VGAQNLQTDGKTKSVERHAPVNHQNHSLANAKSHSLHEWTANFKLRSDAASALIKFRLRKIKGMQTIQMRIPMLTCCARLAKQPSQKPSRIESIKFVQAVGQARFGVHPQAN
jgi:hypothetical protein